MNQNTTKSRVGVKKTKVCTKFYQLFFFKNLFIKLLFKKPNPVDSSDEDKPIRKKRAKRRLHFLDDEAEDTGDEDSERSDSEDGDLSDFIDDTHFHGDEDMLKEKRNLEIEKNKFLLSNHVASLDKTELDLIGLSFAYTSVENIFE